MRFVFPRRVPSCTWLLRVRRAWRRVWTLGSPRTASTVMKSVFDRPPSDLESAKTRARNGALLDPRMNAESPCAEVPRERWIAIFREIGYTSDAWPAKLPSILMRLLRGARIEDQRGLSWTPSYPLAAWFAGRSGGDVWVCEVPCDLNRPGPDGDLVQATSRLEAAVERF